MMRKMYKIVSAHILLALLVLSLTSVDAVDLPTRFCQDALGQSKDVRNWCVKWSEQFEDFHRANVILVCCLGGRANTPAHINYVEKMDNAYLRAVSTSDSSDELLKMGMHLNLCYKERSVITHKEFELWSKNPNPLTCDPSGIPTDFSKQLG